MSQLLLCSVLMQNIQIIYGVPVMFVATCLYVVVVKNGNSLLDHGTLKSAESQERTDEMSWFFTCWHKFMRAKF